MGKNNYTLLFLLLLPCMLFAKSADKYIVYFRDKDMHQNIEHLFSQKALDKRKRLNIPFDQRDYPVTEGYIRTLQENKVTVLNHSDWLNAVTVSATLKAIELAKKFPFVASVMEIKSSKGGVQQESSCEDASTVDYEDSYTSSYAQFHLLNGEYLHQQGFNGENMVVAYCDNGFYKANTNPAFTPLFNESRILGYYDYVHHDSTVFNESAGSHGGYCLSFTGGLLSNQYIGTASKASFYLFQTEDNDHEWLQEEFNLAEALQRCDQLGVDVVTISLGYTVFDTMTFQNHDTSDMKTNNTPGAMAVNAASSKGMLVCVAAGNEGTSSWHYISSPSNADSAFTIASVDVNGTPAASSGWGLATDPRVKPNVAAAGQSVHFVNSNGTVSTGSGTSFATPSLAGMAACLWEAFPSKTNWEIKTAIEQSASQYLTPDKHIGYGIPDFKKAYDHLVVSSYVSNRALDNELLVYPNPFQNSIRINNRGDAVISNIQVINNVGEVLYNNRDEADHLIALNDLPNGMYLVQITTDKGVLIKKLIKD